MRGREQETELLTHRRDGDVLVIELLRELDVTTRAAAALRIEALVAAHRPGRVRLVLPSEQPAPATLSAVGRTGRMCRSLGVPLTAHAPAPAAGPLPLPGTAE
ncbi:hypothetical protein ACI2LJ_21500 [Streptomyces sp. NPDC088090]|uniref:hypothetical protein n=1 Tax=Streptomyces sp. NPDC088090 TaxID=3365822 RepID=UPI00384F8D43